MTVLQQETGPDRSGGKHRSGAARQPRKMPAWVLLAPALAALAVIIGYPIIRAIYTSFHRDDKYDASTGLFTSGGSAGTSNYSYWLLQRCGDAACPPGTAGAQFWSAVGVTLFFTVVTVSLEVAIGFWMATIMGKTFRGRALLRAAVLIPWAIPTAVTAKLWAFMFDTNGIINTTLGTHILWTSDQWPSRFAVIIADVWKTTPFMALLILAGLQLIPADVYEAARVDGATAWQRFRHITLPLVKPALVVAVIFRTMDALRMYDLPAILTSGNDATRTISMLVVGQIDSTPDRASALSTITFLGTAAIAYGLVKVLGANIVRTQETQRKGAASK